MTVIFLQDLKNLGMDEKERLSVYTTIAAVLHLGNVDFEDDPDDNRGGSRIKESSEKSLAFTAKLMGSDPGIIMFNVSLTIFCRYPRPVAPHH